MLTTIEDLASKLDISNQNTRELITKLAIWSDPSTTGNVSIKLRNENSSYFTDYLIPSLSKISSTVESSVSKAVSTKNWGAYSNNEELQSTIQLDGSTPKTNYIVFDGTQYDSISIFLNSVEVNSSFEFICTVNTDFSEPIKVFSFVSNTGEVCSIINSAVTDSVEGDVVPFTSTRTYKISLRYCSDYTGNNKWHVFDYYELPSFKYDGGGGFEYSPQFSLP